MQIHRILFVGGLVMFMLGLYLSSLFTTGWVIIGTLLAVLGGGATGASSYFILGKGDKSNN